MKLPPYTILSICFINSLLIVNSIQNEYEISSIPNSPRSKKSIGNLEYHQLLAEHEKFLVFKNQEKLRKGKFSNKYFHKCAKEHKEVHLKKSTYHFEQIKKILSNEILPGNLTMKDLSQKEKERIARMKEEKYILSTSKYKGSHL